MFVAVAFMGTVDNVLLVQPTAFLAAAALGSLARAERVGATPSTRLTRTLQFGVLMTLAGVCISRLAVQNAVAWMYAGGASTARLEHAATLDPGEYWLEMTLAYQWRDRDRCDLAQFHARQAARLYPFVSEPAIIQFVCQPPRAEVRTSR
jgi:hypothetical protein